MVSRRSSSAVKRRSVATSQDDTPKARKLRMIANPNGITVPTKTVRVKKGRKKEKARMFPIDDCSMEVDEADSSVGSSETMPELPRNVSLSTMSDAHHFGIHGGEIVSAGGDIHINKYCPPNAERSVDQVPTTSSLPLVSESEIWMSRNTAQGTNGSITDLQFPNVIQSLSSYLKGIKKRLIPSRTTVDDIMHSPVFLVDFPNSMIPEDTQTYSRFMLQFRQGYPLYRSTPIRGVSETHWKKGVRIGDVGRIRPDGSFEFLFNINPNETDTRLPDSFETLHHVDSFQEPDYYSRGEHLLKGSVDQTRISPITYKFSASGAILQLPEGAVHFEAQNKNDFSTLASRYAQRWYKYMNVDRSMGAPNGSLYLITGCIKCTSCATAVFSEPYVGENWLEFHYESLRARPRYMWKRMGPMTARVNQNQEDLGIIDVEEPRHCVFLRGFKITLGDKQWNHLIKIALTQYSSQDNFVEASGSSEVSWSTNYAAKDECDTFRQYTSDSVSDNNGDTECSPIIQQLSSSASPMHPSDFINAVLLQRNPEAKVAITHDDDWVGLFPEDHYIDPFSLPVDALLKIMDETYSTIDEHGCVSLAKTNQQEPVQGSANTTTAITKSKEKGPNVSSDLDVGQSGDEKNSSLVPCSVSPLPPVASVWQAFIEEPSPPITTETSTTFDQPMSVSKDTATVHTKEPSPPNDSEHNLMSNRPIRPTPVRKRTPVAVSNQSTQVTQDMNFGLDSDSLSSLLSSHLSPLSLSPLTKAEEERKYEKLLRDEGREIELDNPKLEDRSRMAQGLRSKDEKRIEHHTTAKVEKRRRTVMLPELAFPPQSFVAVGDGNQYYFGSAVRGLMKIEDDVVEASLPQKRCKEEDASQVGVQDLPSIIPSVLESTSLSSITPQHFRQDQHEAGYIKLETESLLQSLTDFGPSSSHQRQSGGSNNLEPLSDDRLISHRPHDVLAAKPKKSSRSFVIRPPPTKTTWECGPDYTTCHHCRRRTYRLKMTCNCGKSWCNACILTRYDDQLFDANMHDWLCPCCQNTCRCDVCTKKRGETYISKRNWGHLSKISPRKKRVFIGQIQPCWGHDMVHKSKVRRLQEGSSDDNVKRLIRDDGEKRKNRRFKKRVYIGNPEVFLELGMKDKYSDSATHDMIAMDSVASSVLNVVNTKLESGWSLTDIKQELIESKFLQSSILRTQP